MVQELHSQTCVKITQANWKVRSPKRHLHWKLQLNKFYLPHQCSLSNRTNILEKAGSRNLIMRSKNNLQIFVKRRTQKLKEMIYLLCNTNSWKKKMKKSRNLKVKVEKMGGKNRKMIYQRTQLSPKIDLSIFLKLIKSRTSHNMMTTALGGKTSTFLLFLAKELEVTEKFSSLRLEHIITL